jgi:hypothetical protein
MVADSDWSRGARGRSQLAVACRSSSVGAVAHQATDALHRAVLQQTRRLANHRRHRQADHGVIYRRQPRGTADGLSVRPQREQRSRLPHLGGIDEAHRPRSDVDGDEKVPPEMQHLTVPNRSLASWASGDNRLSAQRGHSQTGRSRMIPGSQDMAT